MSKTLYDLLEVSPHASDEVIKSSYRALAKKYHPDVYQGRKEQAEQYMKELNAAYDVLSDPVRRQEYDRTIWQKAAAGNQFQGTNSSTPPEKKPQDSESQQKQDSHSNVTADLQREHQYEPTRNTGGGCLWKLIEYAIALMVISVITYIIFGDSEEIRNDVIGESQGQIEVQQSESKLSNERGIEQQSENNETWNESENRFEKDLSFEEQWDLAVNNELKQAEQSDDYDLTIICYSTALKMRIHEFCFKSFSYLAGGGEELEKQPFYRKGDKQIRSITDSMEDWIGLEKINEIRQIIAYDQYSIFDNAYYELQQYIPQVNGSQKINIDKAWDNYLRSVSEDLQADGYDGISNLPEYYHTDITALLNKIGYH